MAKVTVSNVWKFFGDLPIVKNLSLEAEDGEFLVLVGASGCGKSTTLRMLAGLETPTYGSIHIGDDDVTLASPGDRDIAMVFQSYALYPHMSVYKNLSFGPRSRREPKSEVHDRVLAVAETLGLTDYLDRTPNKLSGGQRQRVALGRVMIRSPRLSLLDEPLSNLDAAMRVQMRTELVRLQKELNVTSVYVTHDQVEAMSMGDRIAVLERGVLLQVDTPARLYDHPANEFVATFIGSPKMNVVDGTLAAGTGARDLQCLATTISINEDNCELRVDSGSTAVRVGIRPHDIFWAEEAPARCTTTIEVDIEMVELTGAEAFAVAHPVGTDVTLEIRVPRSLVDASGTRMTAAFDPRDLHLFHPETGVRVITWGERERSAGRTAPSAVRIA
jgi:multiple sugar transport system ATP-binding protein